MARTITTDPSRRQGKFRRLVTDFAATLDAHGAAMPTPVIEQFLADRISVVASAAGISEQTVLRDHFPDSWGADMARRALEDRAIDRARHQLCPDAALPVALVGALIGALGQAQLYAAINTTTASSPADTGTGDWDEGARAMQLWHDCMPSDRPHYSPEGAANATSVLGCALRDTAIGQTPAPGEDLVTVSGSALLETGRALAAFEDRLRRGVWVSCRCPDCTEATGAGLDPDALTLADQVAEDRALLARFAPPHETPTPDAL